MFKRSYNVVAEGRGPLLQTIKDNRTGVVTVTTDDMHIGTGYRLPDSTTGRIKVGTCIDVKKGRWQIVAIDRKRIETIANLG